jgi:hypothetical protein
MKRANGSGRIGSESVGTFHPLADQGNQGHRPKEQFPVSRIRRLLAQLGSVGDYGLFEIDKFRFQGRIVPVSCCERL